MLWFDWVGAVAGILAISGAGIEYVRWANRRGFSLLGRWVGKHLAPVVAEHIEMQIAPVREQLSPNGGNSTYDRLVRLDQWRIDTTRTLDRLDSTMTRHLEAHSRN